MTITTRFAAALPCGAALAGLLACAGPAVAADAPSPKETPAYVQLHTDVLINADLWSDHPQILAANYGFEGIIGIHGLLTANDLDKAIDAGAGVNLDWAALKPTPPLRNLTSGAGELGVLSVGFGNIVPDADAMPIEVSWPLLPSSVSPDNIQITLNTGAVVTPVAAALNPNYDYNERHVIVVFGKFGNRKMPGEVGAVYPIEVTFVPGTSPLMAVGPDGPVSIVGLSAPSSNPYLAGPALVGARLTRYSSAGDFPPPALDTAFPNDAYSLYGADAQYRLRLFTSGGFSPDGVSGYMPGDFASTFRLRAVNSQGETILIDQANHWYDLGVGKLEVLGLAEVGPPVGDTTRPYYAEDHDNYFDIVLKGDEAAIRLLKQVELPTSSVPGYENIYNPGGPGRTPQPGTTYTKSALPQLYPIAFSLDQPGTVSYAAQSLADYPADSDVPVVFVLKQTDDAEVLTSNTGTAADLVDQGASLERVAFANEAARPDVKDVVLYQSPQGDRIYTLDSDEQQQLADQGWTDKGRVFGAFDHQEPGLSPIYRFYDAANQRHYFSAQRDPQPSWQYQKVAWYSALFFKPAQTDDDNGGGGAFWPLALLACLWRRRSR